MPPRAEDKVEAEHEWDDGGGYDEWANRADRDEALYTRPAIHVGRARNQFLRSERVLGPSLAPGNSAMCPPSSQKAIRRAILSTIRMHRFLPPFPTSTGHIHCQIRSWHDACAISVVFERNPPQSVSTRRADYSLI